MALTERLTDIVRNTAYALTASLALANPLASSLYSAEKPIEPAQNYSQTQKSSSLESKTKYSIEEFRKAYSEENWSKIDSTKKKMIEKKWSEISPEFRRDIITIYANPEDFYKNNLNESQKKEYDEIVKCFSEVKKEKKKKPVEKEVEDSGGWIGRAFAKGLANFAQACFEQDFPWIIDYNNPSKSDLLTLYSNKIEEKRIEKEKEAKKSEELDKLMRNLFK